MDRHNAVMEILKHMAELGRPEPMVNVMEVLNHQIDYQTGFDLANDMQNKNLIKIVYCVAPSTINVQLTRVGHQAHHEGKV